MTFHAYSFHLYEFIYSCLKFQAIQKTLVWNKFTAMTFSTIHGMENKLTVLVKPMQYVFLILKFDILMIEAIFYRLLVAAWVLQLCH